MKANRGKSYDAIVTLKVRLYNSCDDYDMSLGDTFEEIVMGSIESEGIFGLINDDVAEIINVEQVEHDTKMEIRG